MNITSECIQIGKDQGFIASDGIQYFLFFPLKRAVFHISRKACDIVRNEQSCDYKGLASRINQALAAREKWSLEPIPQVDRDNNVLGLALTTACNLRCTYCHANAGVSNKFMSSQLIDDSIDYVFDWCREHREGFYLVFTGSGEPTVHWKGLRRAVERASNLCKSANVRIHISMATNGFYGEGKRRYIRESFSRITLSLDGPQAIHDQNRVQVSGSGSFKVAFATAKYFYKHHFPFRIRTTVSEQNTRRMLETFEFFQTEFPDIVVAFEPLNPIGRGEYSDQAPPTEDDFSSGYLSIIDKYGSSKVSYSAVSSASKLRDRFCSPVARPNMNVSVDGRIHSCSRSGIAERFFFGQYDARTRRFVLDGEATKRLSEISVEDFPECLTCFARYNCAGDCHDLREVGFRRCMINRSVLWKLLQQTIKQEATCSQTSQMLSDSSPIKTKALSAGTAPFG